MGLKEKWKTYSKWQKACIILRDVGLYAVLLSALPHVLGYFDNSMLILVCLPLAAAAQAALSWKQDKKTAFIFMFGAIFVVVFYFISIFA